MTKCILCGKEFNPKTKTAKICYDDHYKTCPVCGKSFLISRNNYKQKTCSTACSRILRKKHAEETSLKKYGVKNAGYTKESIEKIKATNLKKYGTEAYFSSDIAKERNKKIWQEKYGVDNPQKSKKIQEKTKETNLKRYGDTNPLGKNSWKREEIDEQNIEKYGVVNLGGTEESKKKITKTIHSKYGVNWPCQLPQCRKSSNSISEQNKMFHDLLKENGIESEYEFNVESFSYDLKIKSNNVLIEIDPTDTHNVKNNFFRKIDKNYHLRKSLCAAKHGFEVVHVWDWDNQNAVISYLSSISSPSSSDIKENFETKRVPNSAANKFYKKHAITPSTNFTSSNLINIGVFSNDSIMACITLVASNNAEYEVIQCASLIRNNELTNSLLFELKHSSNVNTIWWSVDYSKYMSFDLKKFGFYEHSFVLPQKHWSYKTEEINDNLLFKQETMESSNVLDAKLVKNKWLPVYDCGKAVFVWRA